MEIEGLKCISMYSGRGWNALRKEREEIGERLMLARKRSGYSIPEVAEACGISTFAVDAYERGERIPRDSVKIALAKLYRKTVPSLFF